MSHPIKDKIKVVLFQKNTTGVVNASKTNNFFRKITMFWGVADSSSLLV